MKKEEKTITQILSKKPHIVFAYLFGSKVKGYANERSDRDIAVYLEEPLEKRGHWPGFELEAEISRAIGVTVQVTLLNAPIPPIFGFEILRYGILLVDKDPNLRIGFENRTLRNYHDWQYFLKRQMEAERQTG